MTPRHQELRLLTSTSAQLDSTNTLNINDTRQRVRLRAARSGLPPVLIVQAGPGFSLLNEAAKLERHLGLERDFTVAYWDQRGCGAAPTRDAASVSVASQVDDCRAVLRWLAERTGQPVILLGISFGATFGLQAAAQERRHVRAVVAVSIDTDIPTSDAAVAAYLQQAGNRPGHARIARLSQKLGPPPYTSPDLFQLRARMLTDLGGVERGTTFLTLFGSVLYSLIRTYGVRGSITALRNMNAVQRRLLPENATLNLFDQWPRPGIPVHYVFGDSDPLNPHTLVQRVQQMLTDRDTAVTVPGAGHMVHYDAPEVVRSVVAQAYSRSRRRQTIPA